MSANVGTRHPSVSGRSEPGPSPGDSLPLQPQGDLPAGARVERVRRARQAALSSAHRTRPLRGGHRPRDPHPSRPRARHPHDRGQRRRDDAKRSSCATSARSPARARARSSSSSRSAARRTRGSSGSSASGSTAPTSWPTGSRSSRAPPAPARWRTAGCRKRRTPSPSLPTIAPPAAPPSRSTCATTRRSSSTSGGCAISSRRYSDYVSHPIQLLVARVTGKDRRQDRVRDRQPGERALAAAQERDHRRAVRGVLPAPGPRRRGRDAARPDPFQGRRDAGVRRPALRAARASPSSCASAMKHRGVRLYVKRVLVMEDCEEIVPEWLRFIVGVIDSDDLPLNVSREILQESSAVQTIRKQVVKHALDALESLATERPEDYEVVWEAFGSARSSRAWPATSSTGIGSPSCSGTRARPATGLVSLADYVKRMKEGQDAIYFAIGESRKAIENAPHLEGLRKRGFEVLLMTDPIDEWATESLRAVRGQAARLGDARRSEDRVDRRREEGPPGRERRAPPALRADARGARRSREGGAPERPTHRLAVLPGAGERRPARVRRAPVARGRAQTCPSRRVSSSSIRNTPSFEVSRRSSNEATPRRRASPTGSRCSTTRPWWPKGLPSRTRAPSHGGSRRCSRRSRHEAIVRQRSDRVEALAKEEQAPLAVGDDLGDRGADHRRRPEFDGEVHVIDEHRGLADLEPHRD